MSQPENFLDGFRLIDGTTLNDALSNPQWSLSKVHTATSGGTVNNSVVLSETITSITSAAVGSAVSLPQALPGKVQIILNKSANDIIVYAQDGSTIDGIAGNVGVTLQAGVSGVYCATLVNAWNSIETTSAGGMVYPGIGVAVSTGAAWGASITLGAGVQTWLTTPSSANLAAAVSDETGSGSLVFATSPTLVTPILGTPQSGNFSTGTFTWPTFNQNTTGTASNVTGTVAIGHGGTGQTNANDAFNALAPAQATNNGKFLTTDGSNTSWSSVPSSMVYPAAGVPVSTGSAWGSSITLASGIQTWLTTPSSANLAAAMTDETGSGSLVFGTSPTITTPSITFSTAPTVTAGTNVQGQGALTNDYNVITTAAANPSGVTLPTATVGRRIIVVNKGANPINVYPATGAAIDALAANASIQIAVGQRLQFNASSTTQWYSNTLASASGTLAIANGGTGQITANAAFNALAPAQGSASGKFLTSDGTNTSWASIAQMTYPGAGLAVSSGTGWSTSITMGTGVSTALGQNTNTATGLLVGPASAALGGTGLSGSNPFTLNRVPYATTASALSFASPIYTDGADVGINNTVLTQAKLSIATGTKNYTLDLLGDTTNDVASIRFTNSGYAAALGGIASINQTAGGLIFYRGTAATPGSLTEAMRIDNVSNVGIGLTANPSYSLSFDGTAARTVGMERNTAGAGSNMTLLAGAAASGASNANGGTLTLSGGTSTGSGGSSISFHVAVVGAAGTADNAPTQAAYINSNGYFNLSTNASINSSPIGSARLAITQGADYTLGTNYAIFINPPSYSCGIAANATSLQIGHNSGARSFSIASGASWATRVFVQGSNGFVGFLNTAPSYLISMSGDAARTVGMERHTTADTAGNNLTVLAGGATSGATDKNGGNLLLSAGTSTGTGTSSITFLTAVAGGAGTGNNAPAQRAQIDTIGNFIVGPSGTAAGAALTVAGPIAPAAPSTKTGNYSLAAGDNSLIFNGAGTITLTLQAASSYPGRILYVKTIAAQAVNSASPNVVPIGSAAVGTAILTNTAGKWAILQSDGTNWITMAAN